MKKLPIGEQSFAKIRGNDLLYVDKTEQIYRLVTSSNYIFLSRPRRFGKSLTLATIQELFSGQRKLFEGLWIADKWDWNVTHPVVHIPMNKLDYQNKGLEKAIIDFLDERAAVSNLVLKEASAKSKMSELLKKLAAAEGPAVVLVDEYDKPLIDYLEKDELHLAKSNRNTLKAFYSGLKDKEIQEAMRFFMVTGVSKFSHVSIFSDLNYLDDLTLDRSVSELVGYTQAELEANFGAWMEHLISEGLAKDKAELTQQIKTWYNGYSWDAQTHVYNPFSVLNFFKKASFEDYWFKTGTPTFLLKLIEEAGIFNLNDIKVSKGFFESFDLENMDVRSLLFQTGYLTIKDINRQRGLYTLDYPNREVEEAMHDKLLGTLLHRMSADSLQPVLQLEAAFLEKNLPRVIQIINSMLKDVPNLLLDAKNEHFYHALVHLLFRYLGLFVESEVHSSDGRMDAVVQTTTDVFIIEFKINKHAEAALHQIKEKSYAEKYRLSGKTITGIGINFGSGRRDVEGWVSEIL